jgi:hypothetical protein
MALHFSTKIARHEPTGLNSWFDDMEFDSVWITRLILQRALAAIYLIAFIVVLRQFKALLGENGLQPVPEFLKGRSFRDAPTLFHWHYSDRFVDIVDDVAHGNHGNLPARPKSSIAGNPTARQPPFGGRRLSLHGVEALARGAHLVEIGVGPGKQVLQRGKHGAPEIGQAVFHARRDLGILFPGNQPCCFEHSQARGQYARADSGRQLQLLKPPASTGEISYEQ